MVAIIAGSFTIFAALGFMRMIQVHSTTADRASLFASSFTSTALSLRDEIRSSPNILMVDRHSITFVDLPLRDTVSLAMHGGMLTRNKKPVALPVAQGIFDTWEIEENALGTIGSAQPVRLFDIRIGATGNFNLKREMLLRVMVSGKKN